MMTLAVTVADALDEVGADELFALDGTLGALGSRGRLVQHTGDPRWEASYVVARDDGRLVAAVPLFLGHGEQWSDQIHQPADWGNPGAPVQENSALVGGRLEIRGSLRCDDEPDVLRAVGDACREKLSGREVFFGYFDERQRRLAEAMFGPVQWLVEYEDFDYPREVVLGDLADVPRNVRQSIRAGERKVAQLGIETAVVPWTEYEGGGCDLIAAQNQRKGVVDHAALVAYRLDQWRECDDVSVYVAHAGTGEEEGAVSLLVYRDEIEVYEVGLPDGNGPSRRTLYSCLTFDAPRRLAQELSLTKVRAGLGAAKPKRIRGAQAVARACGRIRL
jgi:hypothetical protein